MQTMNGTINQCEHPKCSGQPSQIVRGWAVCPSHARWAQGQSLKAKPVISKIVYKGYPKAPHKLTSGEAWTEWYARHPDA